MLFACDALQSIDFQIRIRFNLSMYLLTAMKYLNSLKYGTYCKFVVIKVSFK